MFSLRAKGFRPRLIGVIRIAQVHRILARRNVQF
jgi:hypothetical protein